VAANLVTLDSEFVGQVRAAALELHALIRRSQRAFYGRCVTCAQWDYRVVGNRAVVHARDCRQFGLGGSVEFTLPPALQADARTARGIIRDLCAEARAQSPRLPAVLEDIVHTQYLQ
jgi:hypothetical protein